MKLLIKFFLSLLILTSCSHDDVINKNNVIEEIVYSTKLLDCSIVVNEQEYNYFSLQDSIVRVQVPNAIDLSTARVNIKHEGEKIVFSRNAENTQVQPSFDLSDFTSPLVFTIVNKTECKTYKLILYDLPVLDINTPDSCPIASKDERVEGCMVRILQDNEWEECGTAGIKGRGNSTWALPKKPYNIKLDKKHGVMGMGESKHWTLLANAYYDKTQLHNSVAFEIARKTDFPWVQSGEYVELILNGEDKGLYYLCEKPRVEKNRINIKELKQSDVDEKSIGGGIYWSQHVAKKS